MTAAGTLLRLEDSGEISSAAILQSEEGSAAAEVPEERGHVAAGADGEQRHQPHDGASGAAGLGPAPQASTPAALSASVATPRAIPRS